MNDELNYRIAVEVLGYTIHTIPLRLYRTLADGYVETRFELPNYSGDIAMAWRVVEELISRGLEFDIEYKASEGWCPIFYTVDMETTVMPHHNASAPLAIAHAALDICAKLRHGGPREEG